MSSTAQFDGNATPAAAAAAAAAATKTTQPLDRRFISSPTEASQRFSCDDNQVKFIYSEKAKKFCEISTVDESYVVTVKSTVEISHDFVAFSEYMNFT